MFCQSFKSIQIQSIIHQNLVKINAFIESVILKLDSIESDNDMQHNSQFEWS